jgi:putative ABC transport system substrate-binding protein
MISRRRIVIALGAGALGAQLPSFAQQKVVRVGYLSNDPSRSNPIFQAFAVALRELGWIEGRNIEILFLSSEGRDERYPKMAAEIVGENVDVIVTSGTGATLAAKAATDRIPIVFGSMQNPVEQKLVASLARPGGNITGLALLVQELGPKRLQLLKEALPRATRFARLYDAKSAVAMQAAIEKEDNAAASALGIKLEHVAVRDFQDIERKLAEIARSRFDAINVKADALLVVNRALIGKLALQHRLPMMGADGRFAEAGALLSYGENFPSRYRRAAFLVDKILRGAKPADIPVEQPVFFEFVVNLRTAQALGVTIPEHILLQADRVIR